MMFVRCAKRRFDQSCGDVLDRGVARDDAAQCEWRRSRFGGLHTRSLVRAESLNVSLMSEADVSGPGFAFR